MDIKELTNTTEKILKLKEIVPEFNHQLNPKFKLQNN